MLRPGPRPRIAAISAAQSVSDFFRSGPEPSVASRQDERVDRLILRLGMGGQLEALREQRANHQLERRRWLARRGRSGRHGVLNTSFNFRDDVEAVGGEPAGPARNLEVLQLIRVADQHAQRDVRRGEAAWQVLESYA
jgi:hypothetical protein